MIRKILLSMFMVGLQTAGSAEVAEPDADLSLNAKMILQELDRSMLQARQRALEKLKAAMKNEMQLGNLKRANRINQEIAKLSTEAPNKGEEGHKITDGEWKTSSGTVVKFKPNAEVEWGVDDWFGTWQSDGKKVDIVFTGRHGYNKITVIRFYCELPVQKEVDKRTVLIMAAQPGYESFTLSRNR